MTSAPSPTAQLISDYADLGVSCGYVGGIHTWGDDRSFRVFTKVKQPDGSFGFVSVHVFDVPYGHKGVWDKPVAFDTPSIREQLDFFRAGILAGTFSLHTSYGA